MSSPPGTTATEPHIPSSGATESAGNTRANVIAGIFTIVYVAGLGSASPDYIFIAGLEIVACLFVTWYAWRWHGSDERVAARDPFPARGLEAE